MDITVLATKTSVNEKSMPNPIASAYNWATSPLVPKSATQPISDAIAPTAQAGPWEARLRGFGQGALEGLRGLTTPLNVASMALPLLKGAGAAGEAVGGLKGALSAGSEVASPLAEFAAATPEAEGAYNAARPVAQQAMDPLESAFQRISQSKGINPAAATGAGGDSAQTLEMMRKVQAAKEARRAAEGIVTTGRGGMGSEVGEVNPKALIGTGLGAGAALYGGKWLKGLMDAGGGGNIQQKVSERDRLINETQGR